jgi:hypothetical protein
VTGRVVRRDALREVVRALGTLAVAGEEEGAPLEIALAAQESGRIQASELLSDRVMRRCAVGRDQHPIFGAFVDGVQESRAIAWIGAIPVVHGRIAAVVRTRVNRRLVTWGDGPLIESALYIPLAAMDGAASRRLSDLEIRVVDTTDEREPNEDLHPQQLLRRAVHRVQRGRESLELRLAEQWCEARAADGSGGRAVGDNGTHRADDGVPDGEAAAGRQPLMAAGAALYIDGGLQASPTLLGSCHAVGVIKSHHTLYATGASLLTVMALAVGERSSVFVVETKWRPPVASWYLRLRNPRGHEPFWGLVRVEVPLAALRQMHHSPDSWADAISRGILAESAPLALPDARWDAMVYGIRDCEVFLRAALGA